MDLLLFFKENYDDIEKEKCRLYCDKLFSDRPGNIGDRALMAVELISLGDIMDAYDNVDDGYERVINQILLFHRVGKLSVVGELDRGFVRHAYGRFITLCRSRMRYAIGLPELLDCVTGTIVDMSSILKCSVEMNYNTVREFNEFLCSTEVYDKYDNLVPGVKSRIVEYIQKGIESREIMLAQSILYFDLQVNFMFDDYHCKIDGRKYSWRNLLGKEVDDVLQFPSRREDALLFAFQYADFKLINALKYTCKYLYKMYLYRRRFDTMPYLFRSVPNMVVRSSGIRFWCSRHERFFCYHDIDNSVIVCPGQSVSSYEDLSVFEKVLTGLARSELNLLRRMVIGVSYFQVLSTVLMFLFRRGVLIDYLNKIVPKYEKFVRFGIMLDKIRATPLVVNRMSDLFRRCDCINFDLMGICDLRDEGWSSVDRSRDANLVDDKLGLRFLPVDMDEMFWTSFETRKDSCLEPCCAVEERFLERDTKLSYSTCPVSVRTRRKRNARILRNLKKKEFKK